MNNKRYVLDRCLECEYYKDNFCYQLGYQIKYLNGCSGFKQKPLKITAFIKKNTEKSVRGESLHEKADIQD